MRDPVGEAPVVLVVDREVFEADYVTMILRDRGFAVPGPFASIAEALALAAREPAPCAAVLGCFGEACVAGDLLELLDRRGVPVLLLGAAVPDDEVRPRLSKPFAAYQVAQWLAECLESRSIGECVQLHAGR